MMEYSSTVLELEYSFSEYSYSKLLISSSRLLILEPKNTRIRYKNQSSTREFFDFYHTCNAYNGNFRQNLLKSSVKINVNYKEGKTSVQNGNKQLNKQLQK